MCLAARTSHRRRPVRSSISSMNPRRIHDLMRLNFPAVNHAAREWVVVLGVQGADLEAIAALLLRYIAVPDVLVEVNRKEGALLPIKGAVEFIARHIGEGEIHVSDRQFTGFVVVAQNGVATGWRPAGQPVMAPDRPSVASVR